MVKVVFSTTGNQLDSPLDSRFGRAPKFIIYNLDAETFEIMDNQQGVHASQGAGIQSAEAIVRAGAKALVTGHCGPKAFHVLAAAGIKIFHSDAATVAEALEQYRRGSLPEIGAADVAGHWS
ncbi:MAG: NifB/NifX family molybdenum-iron cluster-binding protein [Syntrophales bacterium]|jgi:predicted Fe-Mo cluster-binding NifX family protein|nr:NifB/NifX family molybdenum-iron cluster-binding protein [Syntrophales bacterium]